ncbi:hypothetical protein GCM10022221_23680 [Actinocorallia aurea]
MRGYAVVDVETTGFTPSAGEIVEVAIAQTDAAGTVTASWDTLVRPRGPVSGTHVHRITPAMVRDAPMFQDISAQIRSMLAGRVVVAHNLPFDARFLTAQLHAAGLPAPQIAEGVCTLKLARRTLAGPTFKLPDCCYELGIPYTGAHAALADTLATAQLFRHLLTTHPAPSGQPVPALTIPAQRPAPPRLSRALN